MLWIPLSLLTALAVASQDAWVKRHFADRGPVVMAAVPLVYGLPGFALGLVLTPVPPLDGVFWVCLAASVPINGAALVVYMESIRRAPLSTTLPYLAFTPTFMLVTGRLLLGEAPSAWGAAGVLATCVGGYVLNLAPGQRRWTDPLRAVGRDPGAWRMLVVALLFAFAAPVGKRGILHASPMFFTFSFFTLLSAATWTATMVWGRGLRRGVLSRPGRGMAAGLLLFAHAAGHGWAISLTQASYMIAVKRLSIVFGMLYGGLWFGERQFAVRITGAAIMLAGAAVIVIGG